MPHSDPADGGIISGINVTPLVDITLVLLIIFVVTAKIVVTPAVNLDLPQAANAEEVQVVVSILMSPGRPTLVNGEPVVSNSQITQRSMASLAQHPDLRVVIQADGRVLHRDIVAVMDAVKAAGVNRIAFATSQARSEAP